MSHRLRPQFALLLRNAALLLLLTLGVLAWAGPARAHECAPTQATAMGHHHLAGHASPIDHKASGEHPGASDCCQSPVTLAAPLAGQVAARVFIPQRRPLPPADIGGMQAADGPPTEPPRA